MRWVVLSCLLFTLSVHGYSRDFEKCDNEVAFQRLAKELRNYHFLFIPGFIGELVIEAKKIYPFAPVQIHFGAMRDEINRNGITNQLIETFTAHPSVKSVAMIRKAILQSQKPVVLISQSKGGIDVLETLVSSYRKNDAESVRLRTAISKGHIKGWISVQSPFGGADIVDLSKNNQVLRTPMEQLFEQMGGDAEVVFDLRPSTRRMYLKAYAKEIQNLNHAIPILTIGSYIERKTTRIATVPLPQISSKLLIFNEVISRANDGMMSTIHHRLPGSRFQVIAGADHGALTMATHIHDRKYMFQRSLIKQSLVFLLEK